MSHVFIVDKGTQGPQGPVGPPGPAGPAAQVGTYQPIASNLQNVAAMTINPARFVTDGLWVRVWGFCNVQATLALNNTIFDMTLPLGAVNPLAVGDLLGLTTAIGTASHCGVVYNQAGLGEWRVVPPTTFALNYVYSFDYVML